MTASIRILTTSTLDSSPALLLVSPDGSKTLINCGEGCQRSFLESPGLRVRSVSRVCLSHIGHDATGGLPGFILTSADAAEKGNVKKTAADLNKTKNNKEHESSGEGMEIIGPKGTQAFLQSLRHFMRRDQFSIQVREGKYEALPPKDIATSTSSSNHSKKRGKKRKQAGSNGGGDGGGNRGETSTDKNSNGGKVVVEQAGASGGIFGITTIPMKQNIEALDVNDSKTDTVERNIASYLFVTSPIPGKFQIQKAKDLKIPPGPLYAQLKSGKNVTFQTKDNDGNEESVTIHPHQVLEGGSDGMAVLFMFCPDEFVLKQFLNNCFEEKMDCSSDDGSCRDSNIYCLEKYKIEAAQNDIKLETIIHYTTEKLFHSPEYQKWREEFSANVNHITLFTSTEKKESNLGQFEDLYQSPFDSAISGAMTRSLVNREIFPNPLPPSDSSETPTSNGQIMSSSITASDNGSSQSYAAGLFKSNIITAKPNMEYILIPLSKKGLVLNADEATSPTDLTTSKEIGKQRMNAKFEELQHFVTKCGALEAAHAIMKSDNHKVNDDVAQCNISNNVEESTSQTFSSPSGEIIFTGTGSAIPCKHRNVTGMQLNMLNGNGILLDVGEGTVGQLLRSWNGSQSIQAHLKSIKAVWISHPHADHHLGILRFLTERNAILCRENRENGNTGGVDKETGKVIDDRITLIAPNNIFRFLQEYEIIDPTIRGGYVSLDCRDILPGEILNPSLENRLNESLQITCCKSVQVAHCFNSFGIILDCTAFGRVVYSGDCRPSERLVEVGKGADLLIHEATFEDGMEEEAVLKRHSTIGEALTVGRQMDAKAVILTHFSQRYPRIAPLNNTNNDNGENNNSEMHVVFAFDFMKVKPENLILASKLTPALRLLYPEDDDSTDMNDANVDTLAQAREILSVPGTFAKHIQCDSQR